MKYICDITFINQIWYGDPEFPEQTVRIDVCGKSACPRWSPKLNCCAYVELMEAMNNFAAKLAFRYKQQILSLAKELHKKQLMVPDKIIPMKVRRRKLK